MLGWLGNRCARFRTRFGQPLGPASLDELAIVLLGALAAILVLAGAGEPGSTVALAVGSALGAAALVLLALRSMELFVLVVLVLRPAVDGLHESDGWTDHRSLHRAGGCFHRGVGACGGSGGWLRGERHPRSVGRPGAGRPPARRVRGHAG